MYYNVKKIYSNRANHSNFRWLWGGGGAMGQTIEFLF